TDEDFWQWFSARLLPPDDQAATAATSEQVPYLGLTAFRADDAGLFFGREKETELMLNRLHIQPLLAVVGASGAGKSSFVQAGIVPGLIENCAIITLRPGTSPLAALNVQLSRAGLDVH